MLDSLLYPFRSAAARRRARHARARAALSARRAARA